jgi:regulator of replication initiation timing
VIDYENEHGAMLEKTTRISLLTTEDDTVDQVEQLFTSLGGHISSISTYDMTQPVSFTGIVPADSYFMFRQELHDLVSADKYFSEVLNATDLIPSAITLDEQVTKTTEEIASLRKQIAESTDQNQKMSLERQLKNRETQLDSLQESREGLDSRVAYTNVTVMVDEIPGFWETREGPDLRRLVTGFGMPSYFQQIWINILMMCFWVLEIMSYAMWLVIPLMVWLVYRRRQRLAWRELE